MDEHNKKVWEDFKFRIDFLVIWIGEELDKHGFKLKPYRAEWSIANSSLYIFRPDGSGLILSDEEVQKVLVGKKKLLKEDKKEFDAWYEISAYRLGYEGHRFGSKIASVDKADFSDVNKLHRMIWEMTDDKEIERRRKQLAYQYQEKDPKRIDLLCDILNKVKINKNLPEE